MKFSFETTLILRALSQTYSYATSGISLVVGLFSFELRHYLFGENLHEKQLDDQVSFVGIERSKTLYQHLLAV